MAGWLALTVFLAQSRSGVLITLLIAGFGAIAVAWKKQDEDNDHPLFTVVVFTLPAIALVIIVTYLSDFSGTDFSLWERFFSDDVLSVGNRVEIWSHVPDILFQDITTTFIGVGWGGSYNAFGQFATLESNFQMGQIGRYSHNGFIEVLVSFGIIGSVLALILCHMLVKDLLTYRGRHAIPAYMLAITLFAGSFTGCLFLEFRGTILLSVILCLTHDETRSNRQRDRRRQACQHSPTTKPSSM